MSTKSGEAQSAEKEGGRQSPTCPLCKNRTFQREEGRVDSKWGFTSHKVTLLICERCQFVLQFYDGNSIFDFD